MRGLAMLLCIVPAVGMALNGVPPDQLRYASGLFNLMRNLGGAIGIAVVNTWLIDFTREHCRACRPPWASSRTGAEEMLAGLSQVAQQWTPDATRALTDGRGRSWAASLGREAATLAFADTYMLMAHAVRRRGPASIAATSPEAPPPVEHQSGPIARLVRATAEPTSAASPPRLRDRQLIVPRQAGDHGPRFFTSRRRGRLLCVPAREGRPCPTTILYETPAEHIARIVLNRPDEPQRPGHRPSSTR